MAIRVSDVFPRDALRYEPIEKWVRGEIDGETVVDSKRVWLVWGPDRVVPGWCFPREDVRMDLLTEVEPGVWDVGSAERAAWSFDDPDLEGRIQIDFYPLHRWLEEEAEVVGHPRDPFKRIDVRRSSRHVVVEVDGEVVADSGRPLLLFETGLPVRYYLPREDVRMDLLAPSATRSVCAYKGEASHFSAAGAEDVAWPSPARVPDKGETRDTIPFYNESVDIPVAGEPLERPSTQLSHS